MKPRPYIIILGLIATLAIWISAYAQGPGGGSMGGGGGNGMMGGGGMGGQGMMGGGQGMSGLREELTEKSGKEDQNNYDEEETEKLRRQIREKRRELSSLYRSKNSDNKLIDQKIAELNRLEFELDEKMSAPVHER